MLSSRRKFHSIHQNFFPSFWDNDALTSYLGSDDWHSTPWSNIIEESDHFKIELAAPGINKEDFKIKINGNTLEVFVKKEIEKEEKDQNGKKYLSREFGYTAFHRTFKLPQSADIHKIKAKHHNGILEITIPKKKDEKNESILLIDIQ